MADLKVKALDVLKNADITKQNIAKDIAKHALESGDMSIVKQAVQSSAADLMKILPRNKPSGRDVLQSNRVDIKPKGGQ